jgi:hypothetical protein
MNWATELKDLADKKRADEVEKIWGGMDVSVRSLIKKAAEKGEYRIQIGVFPGTEHDAWIREIKPRLEKDGLRVSDWLSPLNEGRPGTVFVSWS